MPFDKKTFRYLEQAKKNEMDLAWFEAHRSSYENFVRKPLSELIIKVWEKFDDDFPGIKVDPSKISSPARLRKNNPNNRPVVKSEASFYLAVPTTSRFEWNPGIYFRISADPRDLVLGVGLYHISARQVRKMRQAVHEHYEEFHALLSEKSLRKRFGEFVGETYTKQVRGVDPDHPSAQYLRYKDFHLQRHYTREELLSPTFTKQFLSDLKVILPLFKWFRHTVGVYRPEQREGPGLSSYKDFRDDDSLFDH
jgi:uncharacterized protein (TIGR02453 family)